MSAPAYGVAADREARVVRVHFGGLPLSWLTLTPNEARELARALSDKAEEVDARRVRDAESAP